jgi:hypothetical protein
MDLNRAMALAAAGEPELRRAYGAAVANGATNTGCTAEEERAYGVLRLLTLALLRLPDLALCAHALHLVAESDEDPLVARRLGDVAAGALRLAHRALQVHGRDVGYETGAWIDGALLMAGAALDRPSGTEDDGEVPVALAEARSATIALTRATAATAGDRMLVPEQVADGLGHLLAIHLIARAAAG